MAEIQIEQIKDTILDFFQIGTSLYLKSSSLVLTAKGIRMKIVMLIC